MRLPRFRFTVRGLMVAVAIAAVFLLSQTGRYQDRISRAEYHERNARGFLHLLDDYDRIPGYWRRYNGSGLAGSGPAIEPSRDIYKDDPILPAWKAQAKARSAHHAGLALKWRRISWQLWRSVPPDPAPPPIVNGGDFP